MLTSTMAVQSSTFHSERFPAGITPALAKRASTFPNRSRARETRASISSRRVTSEGRKATCSAPSWAARASSRSFHRALRTTFALCATNRRAVASPMPEEAPVMRTTFSSQLLHRSAPFTSTGPCPEGAADPLSQHMVPVVTAHRRWGGTWQSRILPSAPRTARRR